MQPIMLGGWGKRCKILFNLDEVCQHNGYIGLMCGGACSTCPLAISHLNGHNATALLVALKGNLVRTYETTPAV